MKSNQLPHEEMSRLILDWIDDVQASVQKVFNQPKIAQEVFNLSKNYNLTTLRMFSAAQDYYEKVWNTILESYGLTAQQTGKNMVQEWLTGTKQAQEEFTKTMVDNWQKAETVLNTTPPPRP